MKREPIKIVNYIEIDGKDVLMDSLPEEKRREIGIKLNDIMMKRAGYQRKSTPG